MTRKEQMEQLALAAVRKGVCVQPGQLVVIKAQVEMIEAVREIARQAWLAGAGDVEVIWSDQTLDRLFYTNASDDTLANPPKWMVERLEEAAKQNACFIALSGADPDGIAGTDPARMLKRTLAMSRQTVAYKEGIDAGKLAWTVIAIPTVGWAKKVYPDLEADQAMDALWNDVIEVSRANGDVLANWDAHAANFRTKLDTLNSMNFEKFHYTASNGTDLWVEIPEGAIFVGGSTRLENGLVINCNIPTEELFTAPKKTGVNGRLESMMPLNWNGKLINGFGFEFKDGKVIGMHADEGEDSLKALLESDPNGCYLGELALVDKNTPIRQLGRTFFNTLIDENAACHFALGQSYVETLPGAEKWSKEELEAHGMNQSDIHVDFMVGADDLHITGYTRDGREVDVFVNGAFAPTFDRTE